MSSERARRRRLRRWLGTGAPWLLWLSAACASVFLVQDLRQPALSPAEGERQTIALAAPEDARVVATYVEPGEVVREGAEVAALDTTSLDRELAAALAELERLTLEVPARKESLAADARTRLYDLMRESEEARVSLQKLLAEQRRDEAELEQLEDQLARQAGLVKSGLRSSQALEELKLRQAALSQEVTEYQELVAAARGHADAAASRLQQHRRAALRGGAVPNGTPGTEDHRLRPLRAAIRAQEQRVAELQARLSRLKLIAPREGVVAAVGHRAGEVATRGAPIVTLLPRRAERVVAWVDEGRAHRVAIGDAAILRPRTGERPRRGQVVGLGPAVVEAPARFWRRSAQAEFGRPVYIAVDADGAGVLPGEAFDVAFPAEGEGSAVESATHEGR